MVSALRYLFRILLPNKSAKRSCNEEKANQEDNPCGRDKESELEDCGDRTRDLSDLPPPYSEQLPDGDRVENGTGLRICPHETLTPLQFQGILVKADFVANPSAKLNALCLTSSSRHRLRDHHEIENHCTCTPVSIAFNDDYIANIRGFGTYSRAINASFLHKNSLKLSFKWEMDCLPEWELRCRSNYRTPDHLRHFLKKTRIRLCEHKKISDWDVVNAVHPILHLEAASRGSGKRHSAKAKTLHCPWCDTRVRVHEMKKWERRRFCRVDTKKLIKMERGNLVATGL
ncbi:hypothetical protein ACLMJK_004263 [Lecanora helva]